jgi:hypothetical protein
LKYGPPHVQDDPCEFDLPYGHKQDSGRPVADVFGEPTARDHPSRNGIDYLDDPIMFVGSSLFGMGWWFSEAVLPRGRVTVHRSRRGKRFERRHQRSSAHVGSTRSRCTTDTWPTFITGRQPVQDCASSGRRCRGRRAGFRPPGRELHPCRTMRNLFVAVGFRIVWSMHG